MTSSSEPGSRPPANSSPDPLPPSRQRLLALSGVAFALLLVFGWFLSGGDAPDYTATDEDWTDWADDNRLRSGIGAFLVLLAGIALLHFAGTIRSVLGGAETASLTSLDGKPLVVVTADTGNAAGWEQAQDKMAALSTNSSHRVAKDTTHKTLLYDETDSAQASQAIHDVVRSVRTGSPLAQQ